MNPKAFHVTVVCSHVPASFLCKVAERHWQQELRTIIRSARASLNCYEFDVIIRQACERITGFECNFSVDYIILSLCAMFFNGKLFFP